MKTRSYAAIFLYVVAVNIPCWIASQSLGFLLKGLFNVEYVVIGILSVFVRRSLVVVLMLSAIVLDILSSISWTYMLSASELLGSARFLFEFAPSHIWDMVAVAICTIMICLMAVLATKDRVPDRQRRYVVLTLGVFVILCVIVDAGTGQNGMFRLDHQLGFIRLTREPVRSLIAVQKYKHLVPDGTNASVVAASTVLVGLTPTTNSLRMDAKAPNLVLILLESWGNALDTNMNESLLRPYSNSNIREKYTMRRGTVPFYGPTIDGEARELCGSAMGFGILTASVAQLKSCLPARLDMIGYHSMGIHGFTARMFDRNKWYGKIGFDETWFRDQLQQQGLPLCPGPFRGICDAAVSTWIGDQLQRNSDSPQFIYWVTLNSHLPVPVPNLVKAPPHCSEIPATAQNPTLCSWYQLVFNVHRSVSELALRPTDHPTIFLIVGDHVPPFSSSKLKSQFSDQVVPYILLMPKINGIREGSQVARPLAVATHLPAETRRHHFKWAKSSSHVPGAS